MNHTHAVVTEKEEVLATGSHEFCQGYQAALQKAGTTTEVRALQNFPFGTAHAGWRDDWANPCEVQGCPGKGRVRMDICPAPTSTDHAQRPTASVAQSKIVRDAIAEIYRRAHGHAIPYPTEKEG